MNEPGHVTARLNFRVFIHAFNALSGVLRARGKTRPVCLDHFHVIANTVGVFMMYYVYDGFECLPQTALAPCRVKAPDLTLDTF